LDVVEIKAAFDSDAIPYQVEWIKPNDSRRMFRRISLSSNGEYRFVVKGESNSPAFIDMIREAHGVMCGEQNPDRSVEEYVNKIANHCKQ
jgi:hypothetical protein